ncbi:MAG: hypothetical protein QGD90_03790 [Candidatus Hydrogenedentes bacterium]|nr:hypothetical protein [Candidatus Hydrogenedentota bacterium]
MKPQSLNRRFLATDSSLLPGEILPMENRARLASEALPMDLALTEHPLAQPLRELQRSSRHTLPAYPGASPG